MRSILIRAALFTCCALAGAIAHAGTPVYGEGKDLDEAMEAATRNVQDAAKKAKRCVSEYPSANKCTKTASGWRCHGVRANQKGSCK